MTYEPDNCPRCAVCGCRISVKRAEEVGICKVCENINKTEVRRDIWRRMEEDGNVPG